MQKDLKIGMVLGLVLTITSIIWLATQPSFSTKARVLELQYAYDTPIDPTADQQETPPAAEPSPQPSTPDTTPAEIIQEVIQTQTQTTTELSDVLPPPFLQQTEKPKTPRTHIVRRGETLSDISYRYYGSANKWPKILNANHSIIKDANKLTPSSKLIIPE